MAKERVKAKLTKFKVQFRVLREKYWPSNLTLGGKIKHYLRKAWNTVKEIEVFNFTWLFVFVIMILYINWIKALVISFFGYLIFLRLEDSLLKLFGRKKV